MGRKKYRKLTTNADIRRKILLNLLLVTICVISFGYSYLSTNLDISGNIAVAKLKVTCDAGTFLPHSP